MIKSILKKGEYYDSFSLMFIEKKISEIEAVNDSAVVMGTKENKSMLQSFMSAFEARLPYNNI